MENKISTEVKIFQWENWEIQLKWDYSHNTVWWKISWNL